MAASNDKKQVAMVALVVVMAATMAAFFWPNANSREIPIGSPLDPNLGVADSDLIAEADLEEQENHPVTEGMKEAAESLAKKTRSRLRSTRWHGAAAHTRFAH